MQGKALTTEEIKQQIARGRNYERLYFELKDKFEEVTTQLHQESQELRQLLNQALEQNRTQAARIEQLETMVFGRKSKLPKQSKLRLAVKRDTATYHRPIPPAAAITATEPFTTNVCNRCGHSLTHKTTVVRYEEDIVLAALDPRLDSKKVTKQVIERGWCSQCGQYSSAKDVRGQTVRLGPVVRSYIVYLICCVDLSYAQVQDLLWQQHGLSLASSEIAIILDERRSTYLPFYERLKTSVRAGPSHLDETRYPIQSESGGGYAHVMAGADGTASEHDVVLSLADSRGKGNSQQLVGPDYQAVGITDRYGSYKYLFFEGKHQICWAHLARNAKDIATLQCFDEPTRQRCQQFYQNLSSLYATVRTIRKQPFDKARRIAQAIRLLPEILAMCQPAAREPKQLRDLKAGIVEYQDCLFVCLTEPNVPPDNNKAERALRKLVIKRKKSLGVKTTKGARTMEVLHSVVQSLANRDSANLFTNIHHLAVA